MWTEAQNNIPIGGAQNIMGSQLKGHEPCLKHGGASRRRLDSKVKGEEVSARQGDERIREVWGKGSKCGRESGIPGMASGSERMTWTMMGRRGEGVKDVHVLKGHKSHVGELRIPWCICGRSREMLLRRKKRLEAR